MNCHPTKPKFPFCRIISAELIADVSQEKKILVRLKKYTRCEKHKIRFAFSQIFFG
jgi:hypothetical protein